MLINREIIESPDAPGSRQAVFDLSGTQIAAVAAAVGHHRRTRFGAAALDADEVLELRALNSVAEQVDELAALGGHAVLRADAAAVSALAHAAAAYVQERDTESYQSPEERERIAVLRELADPLAELARELRCGDRGPCPAAA